MGEKWQLRFNEEKCEAMRITHSRDKSTTNYKLGTALKDVKREIRHVHVVVVQKRAEKCTKQRGARAKLLFCL